MLSISESPTSDSVIQPDKACFVDNTESLRQILESNNSDPVSYEDAQEVADTLLQLYELLAEEVEVDEVQ